ESAALTVMETLLADPNVEDFLQIHVHEGVTWFNKESFELMIDWLVVVAVWQEMTATLISGTRLVWKDITAHARRVADLYARWQQAETVCDYRVETLLEALTDKTPAQTATRDTKSATRGSSSRTTKKKAPRGDE
ncbi:MAG: hypothetical protein R6U25_05335, partial [Alkalispirochaeta sp.]